MFELRDGHVVMRAQAIFQAAKHLPLILERPRVGDVNFQGEEADRHNTPQVLEHRGRREKREVVQG